MYKSPNTGRHFTKIGPWCGAIYAIFWPISKWSLGPDVISLEIIGKRAASLMVVVSSILLLCLCLRLGLSLESSLAGFAYFLFSSNALSVTAQASWSHAAVGLLQVLILHLMMIPSNSRLTSFLQIVGAITMGYLAALKSHSALLFFPVYIALMPKAGRNRNILVSCVTFCIFVYWGHNLGLMNRYANEITISLWGFTVPEILRMLLNVFIAPNDGLLIFSPLTLLILALPARNFISAHLKVALACRLALVLGITLTAVWWASAASLNPTRLLGDLSIPAALLSGFLMEGAGNFRKALLHLAAIWGFAINILLFDTFSSVLNPAPPGWLELWKTGEEKIGARNFIRLIYQRRDRNSWAKPYVLPWLWDNSRAKHRQSAYRETPPAPKSPTSESPPSLVPHGSSAP